MDDILGIFNRMKDMYIRYMDSPFALSHDKLSAERKELLEKEGIIYQYPYVEAMPPFLSSGKSVEEACLSINWPIDFADFASKGLFGRNLLLHQHQFEAFETVLKSKKNIVVTSGTGSGKTESFLLPLMANILNESKKWTSPKVKEQPWWSSGDKFEPERLNETRKAAIRGLILYPLNALVEDQLVRLRKSLDSDEVRKWFNKNRNGNRIYFGRYTGKTPVPGSVEKKDKIKKLRISLTNAENKQKGLRRDFKKLISSIDNGSLSDFKIKQEISIEIQDELNWNILNSEVFNEDQIVEIKNKLEKKLNEKLAYINQIDGAEMNSRWDMQETPPDILITNFSMLNITLTRTIEQKMYEKTKEWLQEDPTNIFFLILDELHTYRGTAGTEVAYVLRSLLNRLGLTPDSPQLRVLATSASLDENGKDYLEDFFGIPIDKFEIINGERENASKYKEATLYKNKEKEFGDFYTNFNNENLQKHDVVKELCNQLDLTFDNNSIEQSLFNVLNDSGVLHDFIKFCEKPRSIKDISKKLFGESENLLPLGGLLNAVVNARKNNEVILPLRAHFFYRNFQGLWACSNPECNAVDEKYRYENRKIGKLYHQPQVQCSCGSRVLDFYYCQNCGVEFLGGYKTFGKNNELDTTERYYLSADFPDLESLPDKVPFTKKYGDYALYYPSLHVDNEMKSWNRTLKNGKKESKLTFSWERANYNHHFGKLSSSNQDEPPTGYLFKIKGKDEDKSMIPAFPIKCPHCSVNWESKDNTLSIISSKKTRSSIRGQKTGFDMIAQVILDSMMRELTENEKPKVVLFSDSRQDAAKLSAKIELNHYYHLLRYVVVEIFKKQLGPLQSYIKQVKGEILSEYESNLAQEFWNSHFEKATLITAFFKDHPIPNNRLEEVKELIKTASRPPKLKRLWNEIGIELLRIGVNPGGPANSLRTFKDGDKINSWKTIYNWIDYNNPSSLLELSPEQERHRHKIITELKENVIVNVLFSQRKRDIESLLLGTLTTDYDIEIDNYLGENQLFWRQLIDSTFRIIGGLRRFDGNRPVSDTPPSKVKNFWRGVAEKHDLNIDLFIETADNLFKRLEGVKGYLIQSDEISYRPPEGKIYECKVCQRVHLHPSCGVCTDCYSDLIEKNIDEVNINDYYKYLSDDPKTYRRFHSEELTGQTDGEEAIKRQQLFQSIYSSEDVPPVDEIDILSVTTTMEAGVDIGSLRLVAMSNMPPQRFNYQQRVGRSGRRGSALSASLTLCRGRSHDDWYFDNLDKMTGDPAPQPYIDLKSKKIFKRVVIKEMLFHAFQDSGFENIGGESVHGEFGNRNDWDNYKDNIQTYFSSEKGKKKLEQVINALSYRIKLDADEIKHIIDYVKSGELTDEISQIAQDPRYSQNALSENLATAGLLPMFGFPTRVRLLHHNRRYNHSNINDLERGTVDRDLEIAISEYSPGSEIIKDKIKHKVVGVAHYWVSGYKLTAEKEPLGKIKNIAYCKNCHILYDKENSIPNKCESCGSILDDSDEVFKIIPLAEPQGFRSDWKGHDFKEEFEWSSRGSIPRLAQESNLSMNNTDNILGNTKYWSQEGNVYTINDNNGNLYNFKKAQNDFEGWIEENQIGVDNFNPNVSDEEKKVALAAIKNTEVMILSPNKLPIGISYDPQSLGVRSGIISFGYLFRRVATNLLDVDADEIQVGLRPVMTDFNNTKKLVGQIFFADKLINGAGYSKYLAQNRILKTIFEDLTSNFSYIPKLREHNCDSSCYECLRTYENMGYHSLLDWRLAFDVAKMLYEDNYIPAIDDKWGKIVGNSLKALEKDYGAESKYYSSVPALKFPTEDKEIVVLFGHPFWDKNEDNFIEILSDATAEAERDSNGGIVYHYDIFDLLRRPIWVIQDIMRRRSE